MAKDNTTLYIIAGAAAAVLLFRKQLGIGATDNLPNYKLKNRLKNLQFNVGVARREANEIVTDGVLRNDKPWAEFGKGMKYTLDRLFEQPYITKGMDKTYGYK